MAQEKLTLKQILACVDFGYTNAWEEFSDEEKKSVSFWLLNRYASCVKGSRKLQEDSLIKTNTYYNKNFVNISLNKETGHSELMWKLLCMCGSTGKQQFHPWLGFGKKTDQKKIKVIKDLYPDLKDDEVETLAGIYTEKQISQLAKEYYE